jgi:hypothetical protein
MAVFECRELSLLERSRCVFIWRSIAREARCCVGGR